MRNSRKVHLPILGCLVLISSLSMMQSASKEDAFERLRQAVENSTSKMPGVDQMTPAQKQEVTKAGSDAVAERVEEGDYNFLKHFLSEWNDYKSRTEAMEEFIKCPECGPYFQDVKNAVSYRTSSMMNLTKIVPCTHALHPFDVSPCIHPMHPAGDVGACLHNCYGYPCHPAGDLYPCAHAMHPAGDQRPCIHPAHPRGDVVRVY